MDKRFEVSVELVVKTADGQPYFDSKAAYHDLPYEGLVAVEKVLLDAAAKMAAIGDEKAKKK